MSLRFKRFITNSLYYFFLSLTLLTFFLLAVVIISGGFRIKFGFVRISMRGIANLSIAFFIFSFLLTLFFYKRIERFIRALSKIIYTEKGYYLHFLIILTIFLYFWWWGYSFPVRVDGDGVGYYSYLRSFIMDGDLRFGNEFKELESDKYGIPSQDTTSTGYVSNPYSIGPAILWFPFFFVAYIVAFISNIFGGNIPMDGYSSIFVIFVSAGTKLYAFLGMFFLWKSLKLYYDKAESFFSTFFIVLATPITYYLTFEPFMSQAHSFFCVSIMIYYMLKNIEIESFKKWFILGVLNGLAFLTRWQDATFSILPLILLIVKFISHRGFLEIKKYFGLAFLYVFTFILTISPQLIVFELIYGFWFGIPQGRDFALGTPKYLLEILFSPLHGLLNWHPILFLSFAGVLWRIVKKDIIHSVLLFGFIIQWFFNSTISQWWGGHSFGMRRLINCTPVYAFGLASIFYLLRKNSFLRYLVILICLFLSAINIFAIKGYIFQVIPHEEPLSFLEILKVILPVIKNQFLGNQIKNLISV